MVRVTGFYVGLFLIWYLVARAGIWESYVVPSPDGASLYVLVFVPEEDGTPAMGTWLLLHRLDAATLRDTVIPRGFRPSTLFGGQLVLITAPVDG